MPVVVGHSNCTGAASDSARPCCAPPVGANRHAGDSLQTNLIIDLVLGLLFYLLFIWFRGYRIYANRLFLGQVRAKPPALPLLGHRRWWSWVLPVFKVPDAQLLESAGLDALVTQRILGGCCFLAVRACLVSPQRY